MEIRTLGPLEVLDGGEPVALGGRKQRALLAVLALSPGRAVSAARLIDDLWGEEAPDTAPKMVQIHVSQLRKVLPPDVLLTRAPGYLLDVAPAQVERLPGRGAAAGGPRGPRLGRSRERVRAPGRGPGPVARAGAGRVRRALRRRRGAAPGGAAARAAGGADRGRAGPGAPRGGGRGDRGPDRPPAAARARTRPAHARAVPRRPPGRGARRLPGRPPGAVGGARHRSLGRAARPGAADPAAGPRAGPRPSSGAAARPPAPGRRLGPRGRRRAARGAGRAARAPRRRAGRRAAPGARVRRGRRREDHAGGGLPGRGRRRGPAGRPRPVRRAARVVGGVHARAGGLGPDLPRPGRRGPRPPAGRAGPDLDRADAVAGRARPSSSRVQGRTVGATQERMLREIVEALFAGAAERPVVLVLEDLHWSDPSTLALLSALARRRDPARLLVVATLRSADAATRDHPVHAAVAELVPRGLAAQVVVGALGDDDVGEYLGARVPGAELPAGSGAPWPSGPAATRSSWRRRFDSWIEDGRVVPGDGGWRVAAELDELARGVPSSVRQLIRRRLAVGRRPRTGGSSRPRASPPPSSPRPSSRRPASAPEDEVEARSDALARDRHPARAARCRELARRHHRRPLRLHPRPLPRGDSTRTCPPGGARACTWRPGTAWRRPTEAARARPRPSLAAHFVRGGAAGEGAAPPRGRGRAGLRAGSRAREALSARRRPRWPCCGTSPMRRSASSWELRFLTAARAVADRAPGAGAPTRPRRPSGAASSWPTSSGRPDEAAWATYKLATLYEVRGTTSARRRCMQAVLAGARASARGTGPGRLARAAGLQPLPPGRLRPRPRDRRARARGVRRDRHEPVHGRLRRRPGHRVPLVGRPVALAPRAPRGGARAGRVVGRALGGPRPPARAGDGARALVGHQPVPARPGRDAGAGGGRGRRGGAERVRLPGGDGDDPARLGDRGSGLGRGGDRRAAPTGSSSPAGPASGWRTSYFLGLLADALIGAGEPAEALDVLRRGHRRRAPRRPVLPRRRAPPAARRGAAGARRRRGGRGRGAPGARRRPRSGRALPRAAGGPEPGAAPARHGPPARGAAAWSREALRRLRGGLRHPRPARGRRLPRRGGPAARRRRRAPAGALRTQRRPEHRLRGDRRRPARHRPRARLPLAPRDGPARAAATRASSTGSPRWGG